MERTSHESPSWPTPAPYQRQLMRPYPRPSGFVFGYLLVVALSVSYIGLTANGLRLLTGVPLFISLIFAGVLYAMKLFFLRRQPAHELSINSGWDKAVGYLVTSIVSLTLATYGLYGLRLEVGEAAAPQSRMEYRGGGEIQPDPNRPLSLEQIEIRIRQREEDLIRLQQYEPSLGRDQKIMDFEEELSQLRERRAALSEISAPSVPPATFRNQLQTSVEETEETTGAARRLESPSPAAGEGDRSASRANENPGPPRGRESAETSPSESRPGNFIDATLAQTTNAMGCWIGMAITEAFILILVIYLRPRYSYWE